MAHIIVVLSLVEQIVQARSEKIAEEEDKCRVMAANAQHDLDEALPALEEAMKVSLGGVGLVGVQTGRGPCAAWRPMRKRIKKK